MPKPIGPTRVVTFYSYKGGVGRTMALVNTAHVLAREGWRVLMVDFDLEAPGMTHFFAQEVRRRPAYVRKDSLDLLLDAKSSLKEADERRLIEPVYPPSLDEYVVPLSLPPAWQEERASGIPYRNGRLGLIPATLEPRRPEEAPQVEPAPDYMERLAELSLPSLFLPGGPGHRFGDHVRKHFVNARFEAPGDILFALRETVAAAYDIVLIDSRTGLNEVAGFSVGTVADALVLCCGLNQQNVEGTRYFMKKAGLFNRKKAKPFLVAVGPVPPWLTLDVAERLKTLRKALRLRQDTAKPLEDLPEAEEDGSLESAFGFPEMLEIPYHPLAAIREMVFVTDLPREPITAAYLKLARGIRSRLLPGALEKTEEHIIFLSLLRNPRTLQAYGEIAARKLPEWRLLRGLTAPIPVFPTACCVVSLPDQPGEIRWDDLGRIPVAAAVAALRLGSPAPFDRAWSLVAALGREHQQYLARCLVYFQSSTSYPLPAEALASLDGPLAENPRPQEILSALCASLAAQKLATCRPGRFQAEIKNREVLEDGFAKLLAWSYGLQFHRRWSAARPFAAVNLLRALEQLVGGTLRDDAESLAFLRQLHQLPAATEEILGGKVALSKLGSSTLEMAIDRSAYSNTPLGLWPEPLAATVCAAAEGPQAIEEILVWLHLARLHYGCAWRVLVDWRYFGEVKEHPRFQAFLQDEEAMVAAVEAAIDRGDFPL